MAAKYLLSILEKYISRIHSLHGIFISGLFFLITRNMNRGYLGFEQWNVVKLPEFLYRNIITSYLGFPDVGFYSSDYFSLFPWSFLFVTGYFLYRLCEERKWLIFLGKGRFGKVRKIGKQMDIVEL